MQTHDEILREAVEIYGARPATRIARMRRGRWVRIPRPWMGVTASAQTIRKRQSKMPKKLRRGALRGIPVAGSERRTIQERRAPTVEDWE